MRHAPNVQIARAGGWGGKGGRCAESASKEHVFAAPPASPNTHSPRGKFRWTVLLSTVNFIRLATVRVRSMACVCVCVYCPQAMRCVCVRAFRGANMVGEKKEKQP